MANKRGTGILLARFQVHELQPKHRAFIDELLEKHEQVYIFLNENPAPSDLNPMEWTLRWDMIHAVYGDALEVMDMPDLPDERIWSQELDRRILNARPTEPVVLYGDEDMLEARYSGRYPTRNANLNEIPFDDPKLLEALVSNASFRAGILYATLRRFPTVYPTVDVAVLRHNREEVLLGRKENELKWRFPGGFCDPADENFEMAVLREVTEECGVMDLQDLIYLGSFKIDDWRYRGSADTVMSHFYTCTHVEGEPAAGDDLQKVEWFPIERLRAEQFIPEHRPLWESLQVWIQEEKMM